MEAVKAMLLDVLIALHDPCGWIMEPAYYTEISILWSCDLHTFYLQADIVNIQVAHAVHLGTRNI